MATRNIVPRATGEGSIGTSAKTWGAGYFDDLTVTGQGSLSDYLPLAGGTMTGTDCEIKKANSTGNLIIRGGTSATDGAYILLHGGAESTSYPGSCFVRATDGVNQTDFVARPDGTLTWGGKAVIVGTEATETFSSVSVGANSAVKAGTLAHVSRMAQFRVSGSSTATLLVTLGSDKQSVWIYNMTSTARTYDVYVDYIY